MTVYLKSHDSRNSVSLRNILRGGGKELSIGRIKKIIALTEDIRLDGKRVGGRVDEEGRLTYI